MLLLTNDMGNLRQARAAGLLAATVQEYVRGVETEFPHLVELLAAATDGAGEDAAGVAPSMLGSAGATMYYTPHVPMSKLQEGLKSGKYRSGVVRLNRDSWSEGTVNVEMPDGDFAPVKLSGREAVNRATEVCVCASMCSGCVPCCFHLLHRVALVLIVVLVVTMVVVIGRSG